MLPLVYINISIHADFSFSHVDLPNNNDMSFDLLSNNCNCMKSILISSHLGSVREIQFLNELYTFSSKIV